MASAWTNEDVLNCFFSCFETLYGVSFESGDRAAIAARITDAVAEREDLVAKQVRYVVDLYAQLLGTPRRDRAGYAARARADLEPEFARDARLGHTHIFASVAQAMRAPGSLGGRRTELSSSGGAGGGGALPAPLTQQTSGFVGSPAAQYPLPGAPQTPAHGMGMPSATGNLANNYQQIMINEKLKALEQDMLFKIKMADLERAQSVINR